MLSIHRAFVAIPVSVEIEPRRARMRSNDEEDEILIHVRAEKLLSCAMDSESAVHSGDEQVLHFISSLAFPFGKHGGVLRVGQRYWGRRRRAHLHTPRQDLS